MSPNLSSESTVVYRSPVLPVDVKHVLVSLLPRMSDSERIAFIEAIKRAEIFERVKSIQRLESERWLRPNFK